MFDQNILLRRQIVVGVHHRQRKHLLNYIIFLGITVSCRTFTTDENIRIKILFQHLPRKIVVNATVVQQRRVLLQGFEYQRNRHGCPDRLTQIPLTIDHLLTGRSIGRYATKRDEQPIEIPLTLRIGRREKLDKGHIDLMGRNQIGRQVGYFLRILQIESQCEHRRIGLLLTKVVDILRLNASAHPIADLVGLEDIRHFVRRIADCIESGHDRPHRGSRDVVDRDLILLERLQYSNVIQAFSPTSTHHHTDLLSRCPTAQNQQKRGNYAFYAHDSQNICTFVC